MNGATVIDVQAFFVNPQDDIVERELIAPVSTAAETVFNLITTIGYVVLFFWLVVCIFGALAPFVGIILSTVITFFLGIPLASYITSLTKSILDGVTGFVFNKILKPVENWFIGLFSN